MDLIHFSTKWRVYLKVTSTLNNSIAPIRPHPPAPALTSTRPQSGREWDLGYKAHFPFCYLVGLKTVPQMQCKQLLWSIDASPCVRFKCNWKLDLFVHSQVEGEGFKWHFSKRYFNYPFILFYLSFNISISF